MISLDDKYGCRISIGSNGSRRHAKTLLVFDVGNIIWYVHICLVIPTRLLKYILNIIIIIINNRTEHAETDAYKGTT